MPDISTIRATSGASRHASSARRRHRRHPLLLVLTAAGRLLVLLGVVALLFTAYQLWGTGISEAHSQAVLRSELAGRVPPPTAPDNPVLAAPSGRRPSSREGGTAPAASHPTIPAVQTAPLAPDPASGQPIGFLQIPKIGLDQVIVEGVDTDQLRLGPGHYPGTPLPGQPGNVSIAGHRTTYAHPFYDLDALAPGDRIVITTRQGRFVYADRSASVVQPTDVSVLDPTATPTLTLTTCNPRYSAATRLVVKAALVSSALTGGAAGGASPAGGASGPPRPPNTLADGGLAGTNPKQASWPVIAGWGALSVLIGLGAWLLARRRRRHWLVYLAATPAVLIVLYFLFATVSPLLPASF